jgi:DNA-binding NarL/FixJ family response regulator
MTAVRVCVFAKHLLFREGLFRLLASEPSFLPVTDPPTTEGQHTWPVDIALIDSRMDGALIRCANLKAANGPRVILVDVNDDYEWCMDALRAGARGLVDTQVTPDTLIRAIHAVHQGAMWIPEHLVVASIGRAAIASGMARPHGGTVERLSAREAEVFRHAATGLSNKDLADVLHITEATVKVHLTSIFAKLGLRGRAELAAAYHGILPASRPAASR